MLKYSFILAVPEAKSRIVRALHDNDLTFSVYPHDKGVEVQVELPIVMPQYDFDLVFNLGKIIAATEVTYITQP